MILRARAIVAVATLAALLAGCTAHVPPPSYTDAGLERYYETRLDAAWANTGLAGTEPRPVVDGPVISRISIDNYSDIWDCVASAGLNDWGWANKHGGPFFMNSLGEGLAPADQLTAYTCFAQFPVSDSFYQVVLTEKQRSYLYDYYQSWIVPCLLGNGYRLGRMPTRDEFTYENPTWSPYFSIAYTPDGGGLNGFTAEQYDEWISLCGSQYADLDVDAPDLFGTGE